MKKNYSKPQTAEEQEGLPEEPANEKFSRSDERQQPWTLSSLGQQPSTSWQMGSAPFLGIKAGKTPTKLIPNN